MDRMHVIPGIQFVVPFTTLLVPNSRNCLSLCVDGGTKLDYGYDEGYLI